MSIRNFFNKKKKITTKSIDPDEIFIDASNIPKFNHNQFEGNIEKTISKKTGYVIIFFAIIIVLVFLFKLWKLEIKNVENYIAKSENNRLRHSLIFAERGKILDRNDIPIASNIEDTDIKQDYKNRKYSNIEGIGNLIGFVKYPQKDSSGRFYQTEIKGMDGIEEVFNKDLAGKNGIKIVEVDALNKIISESTFQNPILGQNIKLSIDVNLSKKLNEFIRQTSAERGFEGGAGALMDLETGEIVALTNFPEYNPQILTDGKNQSLLNSYASDDRKPYLNRSVNGLYTPGSIVKPFIAIGALNEKIISPEKIIVSTGSISIPNEYDPTKKSVFNDWKALGPVDMRRAIAFSSDVYFYEIGGGFEDQVGLGIERIDKYLRLFGFGSTVEDSYLEGQKGVIPTPEWKELNFPNDPWRVGDTYNSVIGQYGMQVTLVQVIRALSAIANDGHLIEPTIIFQNGTTPIKSTDLNLEKSYFKIVKEGMRQAVLEGTASGLNLPQIEIAAKTGTAEVGITKKKVNSWITGFFPFEKPRFAFVVMMEKGPRDNTIGALYVMRQFIEWLSVYEKKYLN